MAPRVPPTIAVIGGGLAGASCAWHLAEQGVRVLLFDHAPEASATHAAAGIMQPITGRTARLAPFHHEGFSHTLKLLRTLLPRHPEILRGQGVLRAALTDDQAQTWATRAQDLPPELARWIDADLAQQTCGPLNHQCRGGLWIPDAVAVDLPTFVRALRSHPGIQSLAPQRVGRVAPTRDAVVLSIDHGETLLADHAILATGTGTQRLLEDSGLPAVHALVPARGELATFTCLAGPLPRHTISSGGYLIPHKPTRTLTVGATFDEHTPWAGATEEGLRALERIAKRLLPEGNALALKRLGCGVRPATRDRVPRVGPLPQQDRISLCTGHGAKGLLLAPLSAHKLAQQILAAHQPGDHGRAQVGADAIPARWRP